ncbi:hypothetical protein B0J13DRAFT_585292 [Dactylonectria estremocensis]|uniref:CRIB domain-containing protein n=1 Tax=Dactylonectria estremocensis TaxID=1079267 RepID=A0A9P9J368_9HYPO|nr:hypothetical protein B0J13DRAFT_585292 [Dactylonectria estremocensis]
MPYYSEYHTGRSDRDANPHAIAKPTFSTVPGDALYDMSNNNSNNNNNNNNSTGDLALPQSPRNMTELLEPAIDGPPSPERIRQLNAQMKRASHLNRGYGHRAASSSASSLLVTDRAGWEQAMESMPLSRRSSNRSATSRSPSQDRPDSVQVMGKNIFHRRAKSSKSGRSKRESSANSSSGSSLYSTETPSENSLANLKDSFMPTIFARRKSSRDETAIQRKLQISGPFNFQHVTHTPRDQIASLQRGNRQELMAEFSTLRVSGPTSAPGAIRGPDNQEIHFPNFSSESVGGQDASMTSLPRPPPVPRQSAPASGTRRLMKHARSQEQLRASPPRAPIRPPRSPIEQSTSPAFAPVPPPRVSSRQSMQRNGSPASDLDRPLTSGGFRRPQPFSIDEKSEQSPAGSYEYMPEPDFVPIDEHRFSHALTTPDDAAWPLVTPGLSYESPLADVPEEEEHFVFTHRPRASLASNTSSLRFSQSVPALRTMSQRMSGASDTLGPLETSATHRATRSGQLDGSGSVSPIRESWEDDIDYCYEHEADANFNYEWERPSLDVGRLDMAPPVEIALVDDELSEAPSSSTVHSSPGMLSASHDDVPALSPASQASPLVGQEASTPLIGTSNNNFSLPRGDRASRPPNLMHTRSESRASSFKECHGFTLSPSLLIPGDYHHQMMLTEAEKQEYPNDEEFRSKFFKSSAFYDESLGAANHTSAYMLQQRASVSTTATNSTTNSTTVSDSTGERHVSTNSTWTTLTRLTSSTSLNKMAGSWSEATGDRVPGTHLGDPREDSDKDEEDSTPPVSQDKDTVPELTPFPSVPVGKRSLHKSHASESIVRDDVPAMRSPEPPKTRRPRARTTSMSTQAPPVGQYALFPRSYIKGNGDRI